jgi:hypothetical protein
MLLDFRAAHGGSSDSSDGGGTSSQQPLCLQVSLFGCHMVVFKLWVLLPACCWWYLVVSICT